MLKHPFLSLSYCLCQIFERTHSDKSRGSLEVLRGTKDFISEAGETCMQGSVHPSITCSKAGQPGEEQTEAWEIKSEEE